MKQFLNGKVTLFHGDSRNVLKECPDNTIDSILTDPPYALVSIVKRFGKDDAAPAKKYEGKSGAYRRASAGFMGQKWDTGEVAFDHEFWSECYRVLKPGGHVLSFGGTRTFHRMVCAIEDAGFEIRDMIQWLYGSGFPKSHDVSKGIDRAAGAKRETVGVSEYAARRVQTKERPGIATVKGFVNPDLSAQITAPATDAAKQWEGWGTALKPACEPICMARKPLSEGTVAANVLKWGTGAINVDGCRVATDWTTERGEGWLRSGKGAAGPWHGTEYEEKRTVADRVSRLGRWPANVIHDGSDEVLEKFPSTASGKPGVRRKPHQTGSMAGMLGMTGEQEVGYGDEGSAARFFYAAKANKKDRAGSKHPTVKPISLLRYLAKLITPPEGIILDPFAGSGTTGEAAYMEGFRAVLIEREEEYAEDIARRLKGLDNVIDRTESD